MYLKKLALFLILVFCLFGIQNITLSAQETPATNQILIPLENLIFTPDRSQFNDPGVVDLEVKIVDFVSIPENSRCRFNFSQIVPLNEPNRSAQISENFVETTYTNKTCAGVLKKEQQKAKNIRISIEVTSPDNQKFGAFINFFIGQEVTIVDPQQFTLPDQLYIKPEINIILQSTELQVGQTVKAQIEITNKDTFLIRELSVKNSIPNRVGKIACDSLNFTEDRLNGQIIKNPFLNPLPVVAQTSDPGEAKCIDDEYNFEVNLVSLGPKKTTRLNFDVNIQKAGELRFDITTNLDQGKLSKQTKPILIISPKSNSNGNVDWAFWIGLAIAAGTASAVGLWFYLRYRKNKKHQELKPNQNISEPGLDLPTEN